MRQKVRQIAQKAFIGFFTVFLYCCLLSTGIHSQIHVHHDGQDHVDCVLCLHANLVSSGETETLPSLSIPFLLHSVSIPYQYLSEQWFDKLHQPRAPPTSV